MAYYYDYWRNREKGWREQGILSPFNRGDPFTRYDYARLWVKQRGKCGLCDLPFKVETMRWSQVSGFVAVGTGPGIDVDHARSHGRARALLHGLCNRRVGAMNSSSALLVLNYLLKHEREGVPWSS